MSKKRLKVADLKIKERDMPLLVYVQPAQPGVWSGKPEKLPLLHICRRNGKQKGKEYRNIHITNCNRPLAWADVFACGVLDESRFRLCPRCGTRADFEAALTEYWAARTELRLARKEKEAQEEAQKQQPQRELDARL